MDDLNYNIDRNGWWSTDRNTITVKAANAEFIDNMSVNTPIDLDNLGSITINITPKDA
jgi:hypothetical protein